MDARTAGSSLLARTVCLRPPGAHAHPCLAVAPFPQVHRGGPAGIASVDVEYCDFREEGEGECGAAASWSDACAGQGTPRIGHRHAWCSTMCYACRTCRALLLADALPALPSLCSHQHAGACQLPAHHRWRSSLFASAHACRLHEMGMRRLQHCAGFNAWRRPQLPPPRAASVQVMAVGCSLAFAWRGTPPSPPAPGRLG